MTENKKEKGKSTLCEKRAFSISDRGVSIPVATSAFCEMESCPVHENYEPILENEYAVFLCLMCKHNKRVDLPEIVNMDRKNRKDVK